MTLVQKIMSSHLGGRAVSPGEIVMLPVDVVMGNDGSTSASIKILASMGVDRVFDPAEVVTVADHFAPAKGVQSAILLRIMEKSVEEQGVTFYAQGRGGIEHTVLIEDGWIVPGSVVAGGDSHTCTCGALGSYGTGVGFTDLACGMAVGALWQAVPETIRVFLTGAKQPFVTGKDVILAVLARIGVSGRGAVDRRARGRQQHGRRGRGGYRLFPGGCDHRLEGLDPGLRDLLTHGPTVLFVPENFGTGSSREQPVAATKFSSVQCVVGKSFARIFARDAINTGMPHSRARPRSRRSGRVRPWRGTW